MGTWTAVAKTNDIRPNQGKQVTVSNKVLAVFNVEGTFYAIDDACTHAGGSLSESEVRGKVVTCPWHAATFDVTTGDVLSEPAFEGVHSYKVKVQGEDVLVEI